MGSGKVLKYAIKKHGIENFKKEILHVFDTEEEMNAKEKELVVLSENSYNLCEGGKGGFGYINANGLSDTKKGRIASNEVLIKKYGVINPGQLESSRTKASERFKLMHQQGLLKPFDSTGTIHSEETKRKIGRANSLLQKGNKNSQYGTCWIVKDGISRKIKKDDLPQWLTDGFKVGRK